MQHVGDLKPWHTPSSQVLIGRMKINFLSNWTLCSDNRDANLRDRASLSWWVADTICFMRSQHWYSHFSSVCWNWSSPSQVCLQNYLSQETINAVAAGCSSLTEGWIDCSLVSPESTGTCTCPGYPSLCRRISESHWSKKEQRKDSKVCLLASATNLKEIQFYDNHKYRSCATDSMHKHIWETNTF